MEVRVVDVHMPLAEIRDIQEIRGGAQRRAGGCKSDSLENRGAVGIDFDLGDGRVYGRVPARDSPILGDENELCRISICRVSGRELEVIGAVEDLAGGCAAASVSAGDRHDQALDSARAVVERRQARSVIGNPPGAAGTSRETPRIDEVRVGDGRYTGHIRDQFGLLIVLRGLCCESCCEGEHSNRCEAPAPCMLANLCAVHGTPLLLLWLRGE